MHGNAGRRTTGRERKFVSGVNGNSSEFTLPLPYVSLVAMQLPSLVGWSPIKGSTSVFATGSLVILTEVAIVELHWPYCERTHVAGPCIASISMATLFIDP